MAATATTPGEMPPATRNNRGKDQIHWSEGVWKALDSAVMEEMLRTRVAAKFLPHVHVERKQTTVPSDVVVIPLVNQQTLTAIQAGAPFDPSLSVDESAVDRIHEYWATLRLSVAQVEEEEHEEMALNHRMHSSNSHEPAAMGDHHGYVSHSYRASTAVSLAIRTANILAQAEDLVLFNGQNGVVYSPLFTGGTMLGVGLTGPLVQALDPKLSTDLDLGLLNIKPLFASPPGPKPINNDIQLPSLQVIPVHPTDTTVFPPRYAENTLNAVAQAFSTLQALGHYEHYALALHTVPYADLHEALKTTLIEPVEPISHLIKAGVHGTGTLPPFIPYPPNGGPSIAAALAAGLPTSINNGGPLATPGTPNTSPIIGFLNQGGGIPNILYTGVLVSLSGNTMDIVRGHMEDNKDVIVTFNQKDANEQYRFRTVQRFALRLKDTTAVVLLLFMDS
jgi:hypothetical protein